MEIIRYTDPGAKEKIQDFLKKEEVDPEIEQRVDGIIEKGRLFGDSAVSELTQNLDGVLIEPGQARVEPLEFSEAVDKIHSGFQRSFEEARANIHKYYFLQRRKNSRSQNARDGFSVEMIFSPIDTVGLYIPGGTAPLVSTVLMSVVPAQIAGVKKIVVCTPPNVSASIHPYILAACHFLGVHDVYKVGGAQAIAAMAYGTQTIPSVDKIFGPGNIYVSLAKAKVFGQVAVDMIAGPSEVVILADGSANCGYLAADMISQAEHDKMSRAILVTDSPGVVENVKHRIYEQLHGLPRREIAEESIRDFCLLVLVEDLEAGAALVNELAPEHLEIVARNPRKWLAKIRNAGAVFLGEYSPVAVGDFIAGPSHVLPTNRSARAFSGITLDDYLKKINVIEFSKKGLQRYSRALEDFATVEGLEGHLRSTRIRLSGGTSERTTAGTGGGRKIRPAIRSKAGKKKKGTR